MGDSYTVEGNVTFTATWDEVVTEPTEYTVTYALGAHAAADAELPASVKVEEGTQITLPAAPAPENGWQFTAWSDGGNTYAAGSDYEVNAEVTFTAQYEAVPYTISYENLNGTTVSSATEYTVEKDVTFATPSARTGYNFVEWRLKNADGQVVTSTDGMTENLTVWAVWEAKTFTVTLNYNYPDAPASKTITVTFGTTFGAASGWEAKPERSGYVFLGWNENAQGTGKAVVGTDTVDKELTDYVLYAQWEIVGIQVTFDANGGTIGGENTFVLNVTDATVAEGEVAAPVREGYRFDAWYTQAEGGEKVAFPISVSGKATYYAQWIKVWTVTVDGQQTTVDNNGTYQLTKPEAQEGKTFMGWASEGSLLYSEETTITVTADVTLTTVWATHNAIATEAELLAVLADETASEICLAQNIELTTAGINVTRDFTIDLNKKTITFTTGADVPAAERIRLTAYGTSASERIALTLTNGMLDFATNNNPLIDGSASMIFTQYVDLTMTHVTVSSDAMGVYFAVGSLNLTDCAIAADGSYAVGTNASLDGQGGEKYGPVNMTITRSLLTAKGVDGAGLLFNVSGELTLTNTGVFGGRQGLILRKGTATITGGSIVSTWADAENADEFLTSWGSGTAIPMAALVIGDASKGVYNGDAVLTISRTQVRVSDDPEGARYVYLAGDTADGTFAKLIYACSDKQMTALQAAGKIIVANENASVEVKHGELNHHDAQPATCLEDGWKEYYQCPDCDQYFDADKQAVAWEELVIKAAGAHSYGAPVYNAETKSVEVSCTYGDDTKSATVTVGDLTLESADFTLSETGFTLTIPLTVPAAETGKYFKGWLGGDILYYPGEKVDVAFGGTLALTAQFSDLYQSVTESNVQLLAWPTPGSRAYALSDGVSITLTANLEGTMITDKLHEGIYAQVFFGEELSGTSDIVFRPDFYYFSGSYNRVDPQHPNVTTCEITSGGIGTAEEFNGAKLANVTKIELSKTGTTVTIVYSVGDYLVCTYTLTGMNAAEQTVYFLYDGANITVKNLSITSVVKTSENQWPTAEEPLTIGDVATGYTPKVWTSSISKGEKVTFTGTMTSAGVDNYDTLGVQVYSCGMPGWFFRGDNWVNGASSQTGNDNAIAAEGWTFTKSNTCGNWDAFREEIKNCAVTVTVDWTNETQIVITMAFGQYTQTYTITASSGELAQDYVLGFGFENSQTIFTNVVRTSVKA
ncbi:MAG TPA: InlB B-repeat-containing protein [Firmicutes bacterium]|nr:InlB B-repeat-containing protein [Bacillota bacterium]